jgi:immunoglobulin-like protein involved in spore germination
MRMSKGIVVAALLALVLGLSGCGSGDDQTVFVLPSGSPSASASGVPATGSPSPGSGAATPSGAPAGAPSGLATPIPGGLRIIIDSPDASSTISSPVEVTGAASVGNGTVVAVVLDASGAELGRATTTASAAAPDFGHYDAQVTFSGAASGARGTIKVFGVRADGQTPTWYYFIAVRFA